MLKFKKREFKLEIKPGECWAIVGENGAGKSTLINQLCGLCPSPNAEISYKNTAVSQLKNRAQQLGLLPQLIDYTMPIRVIDAVSNGRYPHPKNKATDDRLVRSALETVGLSALQQRFAHTLSGGEQQRVAIATLLTQDPEIYFLDEPTNHLDLNYQLKILSHFKKLCAHNKSVVVCTHDTRLIQKFATHCLVVMDQNYYKTIPVAELRNTELLKDIYQLSEETAALL